MANENSKILTREEEMQLRKPMDDHIGGIQAKLDSLRAEESPNKGEISKLVREAEDYLKAHFDQDYYQKVKAACEQEKIQVKGNYDRKLAELKREHQQIMAKLSDHQEIKDEKYVYKNRLFDAKMKRDKDLQQIKDRRHAAYAYKFHLIDLLRMSKYTIPETMAQKWENYKYTFNRRTFLLQNGLYIAIALIFIMLCIITPMVKNAPLLTYNNVLNIFQQASPRMFLALGVAGLILLTGTDLSIGRMVGMGMTAATIIMHQGINTGSVFGHVFDFTGMPIIARVIFALVVCIILCTIFTAIAGFFTAKFKMHPFISTMANMLVIFGLVTYATKGVSFGAIEPVIPTMIIPKVNGFHPVGGGSHYHRMVHLEQDHLWQESVCGWWKSRSGIRFRYLRIQGNGRSLCDGRYPVRLWILAGMCQDGGLRLRCVWTGLGDGRHRSLRSGRRILYRWYRQDFRCRSGRDHLYGADIFPDDSGYRYKSPVRILRYHYSCSSDTGLS